jgi:hypothetical protein
VALTSTVWNPALVLSRKVIAAMTGSACVKVCSTMPPLIASVNTPVRA